MDKSEVQKRYEWVLEKYKEELEKLQALAALVSKRHDELIFLSEELQKGEEYNE